MQDTLGPVSDQVITNASHQRARAIAGHESPCDGGDSRRVLKVLAHQPLDAPLPSLIFESAFLRNSQLLTARKFLLSLPAVIMQIDAQPRQNSQACLRAEASSLSSAP